MPALERRSRSKETEEDYTTEGQGVSFSDYVPRSLVRPSTSIHRGFGWSTAIVGNNASDSAMGDDGRDHDHHHSLNTTRPCSSS